jgi:uncharacterized protein
VTAEARPVATVLWRRLDVAGVEHFRLWTLRDEVRLEGVVIAAVGGAPLRLGYEIACSADWATRRVAITLVDAQTERRRELRVDDRHRWWAGGKELTLLAGCVDVDVSLTPSTNTLPVRRLGLLDLAPGDSRDVTVAWVGFPELSVESLPQRYTRLAGRRFRYESAGGAFTTELEVDEDGLVVSYPPFWERAAG